MRRRFTVDERGLMVDRDGSVLGRVVGITIELATDADLGGRGVVVPSLANDDGRGGVGGPGEGEEIPMDLDAYTGRGSAKVARVAIDAVLTHYAEVMKPRNTVFGAQERKVVREALKVATVGECKRAISACAESDYHMKRGEYARRNGAKYNKLSQILRGRQGKETTRERIDFFLERGESAGGSAGVPTADHAKIRAAMQQVRDGWQFPGDVLVVRQGEEAASWLATHGYTIIRDPETDQPMKFELTS